MFIIHFHSLQKNNKRLLVEKMVNNDDLYQKFDLFSNALETKK